VVVVVLALHAALLLRGAAPARESADLAPAPVALDVRMVSWTPEPTLAPKPAQMPEPVQRLEPAAAPLPAGAAPARESAVPTPPHPRVTAPDPAPEAVASEAASAEDAAPPGLPDADVGVVASWNGPAPAVAVVPTPAVTTRVPQPQPHTASPAAAAGAELLPTYATLLPPPVRWRYRMRRGLLSGVAILEWRRDGDGYRLSIDGSVAGVPIFEWVSTGGIDAHGVAPERLVMRAAGRAARAANFQRDVGKITYSGHDAEHALLPGTQDRVSWLLQLSGVVAAAPARFAAAPTQIALPVSGVRGDLAVWRFDVVGEQAIDISSGRVQAIKLRREAERAFDTRGEIWLDPQRHHLPVRFVLSTIGRNGEVVEALTLELESTR